MLAEVREHEVAWDGLEHGALWISGDTVLYPAVSKVAERLRVDTALLHLGGVRFPVTGSLRYTRTARDAVELCRLVRPRTATPIHYEGWGHFKEGREAIERERALAGLVDEAQVRGHRLEAASVDRLPPELPVHGCQPAVAAACLAQPQRQRARRRRGKHRARV